MEELVLSDRSFILKPDLASALAQAKKLSWRGPIILLNAIELKAIKDIVNTSKSLSKFHIYHHNYYQSKKEARMFAKSLRENAAESGRAVDVTFILSKYLAILPRLIKWFPFYIAIYCSTDIRTDIRRGERGTLTRQ